MSRHRQGRNMTTVVAFCVLSVAALGGIAGFQLVGHPTGTASDSAEHTSSVRSLLATDTGTPPGLPTATPTTEAPKPLHQGSSGSGVAELQHRLAALGYQSRKQTGSFDSETAHAVTAFEKLNGLPADGVAGPAVLDALDHSAVPRQRHPHAGLAVEVDLARQVAVVFQDGVVKRIYDVCTGKPTMPTPTGEFAVKYKINGMHHAPLGPMWRPVYFNYDGFAFHGAEPVLTTPSSHGCVRMTDPAMDELFAMLTPGVPVTIY
ncbi:MAG TPA: L,D-transpeptidase family protein [Mycobacteriales bacterium]